MNYQELNSITAKYINDYRSHKLESLAAVVFAPETSTEDRMHLMQDLNPLVDLYREYISRLNSVTSNYPAYFAEVQNYATKELETTYAIRTQKKYLQHLLKIKLHPIPDPIFSPFAKSKFLPNYYQSGLLLAQIVDIALEANSLVGLRNNISFGSSGHGYTTSSVQNGCCKVLVEESVNLDGILSLDEALKIVGALAGAVYKLQHLDMSPTTGITHESQKFINAFVVNFCYSLKNLKSVALNTLFLQNLNQYIYGLFEFLAFKDPQQDFGRLFLNIKEHFWGKSAYRSDSSFVFYSQLFEWPGYSLLFPITYFQK